MANIGGPLTVRNTDGGEWIVTLPDAVTTTTGESVSIVVGIRRDPTATLTQVQSRAVARAIELLQAWQAGRPPG